MHTTFSSTLSLGLIVAAASTLVACSSDEGEPRPTGAAGNTATGQGGTSAGGASANGGRAGNAGTTARGGAAGASTSLYTLGAALTINDDGTVVDTAGTTAINGAALFIKSPMNPAVTLTPQAGKLCLSGTTAIVAGGDYTAYWGASISLDLNLVATGAGADAGADAGDAGVALGTAPQPWDPREHNVIGFSFKLEGQDPALGAEAGVPPEMRLQSAPTGGDPATQTGCYTLAGAKHNVTREVLFSDIVLECYNPTPLGSVVAAPFPGTLQNLGWQVNASPTIAYQFNFCVTEIKPILGS